MEFQAIYFGTEILIELVNEMTGDSVVVPVNIQSCHLYTDSMVCLHWIRSCFYNFDKMQKRSIFIMNRLRSIETLCREFPISFRFTSGKKNPADPISRPFSYRKLIKTEYYSGPGFLQGKGPDPDEFTLVVPSPISGNLDEFPDVTNLVNTNSLKVETSLVEHLVPLEKYSTFSRLVGVFSTVLRSIRKFDKHNKCNIGKLPITENLFLSATSRIIATEQKLMFSDVFEYFGAQCNLKDIPPIVTRLNLQLDDNLIIRVKSKFSNELKFPILLHQSSPLTVLIVKGIHGKMSHIGIYAVLREFRKQFYVQCSFSTVRKILRQCVICRRSNARPIKLNQSSYRDFRIDPPRTVFSCVFLDYIGPFGVRSGNREIKVWLLILTCLWSRAINIKICINADVKQFLRAVQLHVYDHGMFRSVSLT